MRPRARQNVIMELGYFIAHLKRSKVCALKVGDDLELPSDVLGVVWTPFDAHGAWQSALAKELKAAGYDIDLNKIMAARHRFLLKRDRIAPHARPRAVASTPILVAMPRRPRRSSRAGGAVTIVSGAPQSGRKVSSWD